MARQASIAVENSFVKGLITEATALNFPENACTDTVNCIFDIIGSVERRLGYQQEHINTDDGDGIETLTTRTGKAISQYKWKNVSGNGDVNVLVLQIGRTIYFFRSGNSDLGNGLISDTIDLTTFSDAADSLVDVNEATYSNNSKLLIITHPYCNPVSVSYAIATDDITTTSLTLKIRDFEGDVADALAIRQRPTASSGSMTVNHKYNLYNQGWRDTELTTWDTARTDMPSNADVWWTFKVPTVSGSATLDQFSTADIANHEPGNSPAPKGHFILTAWSKGRDAATTNAAATSESVTGLSGTTTSNSGDARPGTSAFFAGRIFYAGIASPGFSSDIFFTQILERDDQLEKCYQDNDPTAEDLHDLLASDGGVIKIPEAGKIVHLFAMSGGLVAFATNGIWLITGSTGLGFVANDYVIQKLSTINAISPSSFVDVAGFPMWWNHDGIYALVGPEQGGTVPVVKPLTLGTIQTYYDSIPPENKPYARGYYHPVERIVQWIFNKDTVDGSLEDKYNFRNVLNLNTISGAWYPWTGGNDDFNIIGITVMDGIQGFNAVNNVVNGANNVVDGSTNQVITFSFAVTQAIGLTFKYTTADGNDVFFSEERGPGYIDWDDSDPQESFFITGYKLRGQGITKQQATWIELFTDTANPDFIFDSNPLKYTFIAGFDYPNWDDENAHLSQAQTIVQNDLDPLGFRRRTVKGMNRLKIRGHGKAVQFKVTSVDDFPFRIDGWVTFDTKNSLP